MRYTQTLYQLSADTVAELELHDNQFDKISRFGINFMRKMNNEVKGEIKTERFLAPITRIIKLPESFIDYSKIGRQWKEGVQLLAQNYTLAKLGGEMLPSAYPAGQPYTLSGTNDYFYGYGGWAGDRGRIMAYNNGNDLGSWTLDPVKKELRLSSDYDLNSALYIEYLSDCLLPNGKSYIHPFMQTACQMYQKWNYFLNHNLPEERRRAPDFERLYNDEVIQMKYLFCQLDTASIRNLWEFQFGAPE